MIKLLLTSSGVTDNTIEQALVKLLGKPISEANALFVPTGVYPFEGGSNYAWWPIAGEKQAALVGLGWQSMGLLELTALESIEKEVWLPSIEQADAILVWGGDPLYLAYWFERSGLKEELLSLKKDLVYVGVSAGSMAACTTVGETYGEPRRAAGTLTGSETVVMEMAGKKVEREILLADGIGLAPFAIIPHYNNPNHADACGSNAELWAAKIPSKVYAIGEQAAITVIDQQIEIVGDGEWKVFNDNA